MLKARKRNRIVRILDEKTEEYKKLGYTITDMDGSVIYEPEDKDAQIATLSKENAVLKQKIAEYELLLSKDNTKSKETSKEQTNDGRKTKSKAKEEVSEAE